MQRGEEKLVFKQTNSDWRLTAPVNAEADRSKVQQLAGDLSRLEVVEYVNDPKPADCGLDKPALTATLTFSKDNSTPPVKLLLGKQHGDKPEYYACLDDRKNEVFLVRQDIHDKLDRDSLAFRPLQFWHLQPSEIATVRIQREGEPEYRLLRKDKSWQIAGRFEAEAMISKVQPMEKVLADVHGGAVLLIQPRI